MKTLFILAAGALQIPSIVTAKKMGLRVIVADGDPQAPGLAMGDVSYVLDIADPEACLDVARREKIDGVLQICCEVSIHVVGFINQMMGLKGIDLPTALRCTNKEKMRRAFEAGGAPSPFSVGATTLDDTLAIASRRKGSLIFKPSRNSGSRGVTRVESGRNKDAVTRAFEHALRESRDHSIVVEEFVDGPEFSIEALTWNGQTQVLTITDKQTTGAPYFVETGHSQPTSFGLADRTKVESAAIAGIRALGIDWSASHAEVKLSPHGPFIMEIGARLGGDFITTELVPRSTGIDMVAAAIRLALGEIPDLTPAHAPQGAAIRYLTPSPGQVVEISGIDAARGLPGVQRVAVDVSRGDVVPPITSSLSRIGYVIAEGKTAAEAVTRAEFARAQIHIVTK